MTVQGIIFDIDGVLTYQGQVCDGASETVRQLRADGITVRFLTNSTLKSRASCAEQLRRRGFTVSDGEVFTASYLTAEYLRGKGSRSCWVMLEGEGLSEFGGFAQDHDRPEYLVVGDNRSQFDFEHLNQALRALLGGAALIGMQPGLIDRSAGDPELDVGAWVGMLERASGTKAIYVGKPNPFAFEVALQSMNLPKERVLVVGDQLQVDIAGAQGFGMRGVLVRGGEGRPAARDEMIRPDLVVDNIAQIMPHLPAL